MEAWEVRIAIEKARRILFEGYKSKQEKQQAINELLNMFGKYVGYLTRKYPSYKEDIEKEEREVKEIVGKCIEYEHLWEKMFHQCVIPISKVMEIGETFEKESGNVFPDLKKVLEEFKKISEEHEEIRSHYETMGANISDFIKMKDKLKKVIDDLEQREKFK